MVGRVTGSLPPLNFFRTACILDFEQQVMKERLNSMTVVIIGGDAAGMSAASRIARKDKNAHVIVYEKTDIVSYGACGLPFYLAE